MMRPERQIEVNVMTPMEGSKCLLYLRLGWKDDYFRLLDRALEQEDPLSPLTLELALCGSNTSEAQSVLRNDPGVSSVSEDEILEWAKAEVDHFAMYFFADDLKFFRRSGRVSGLAATMGTLIGVRPLIHMSQEGKMVSVGTAKGRQKAIQYLVDKVGELGDQIEKHRICIGHTDAPEIARTIAGLIEERYGKQDIVYVDVNPTAGSHCGPNGVGVCFHAKSR